MDENTVDAGNQHPRIIALEKELTELASAAHNFYVTVVPWMHHKSNFLIATEKDLKHVLGKHIDAVITSAGEILPHVQSGKARTLAMVAEKRFAALPDVPTTVEMGYDADVVAWRGLVAPKGTPKATVNFLLSAIEKTAKDPGFLKFMKSKGITIDPVLGNAFGRWLVKKNSDYAKLAKMAGLSK